MIRFANLILLLEIFIPTSPPSRGNRLTKTKRMVNTTYVESSAQPGLQYFASKIVFGRNGVEEVLPIGDLSDHEKARLAELTPILQGEVADGIDYAKTREFGK